MLLLNVCNPRDYLGDFVFNDRFFVEVRHISGSIMQISLVRKLEALTLG
jgi:hypothetical protein